LWAISESIQMPRGAGAGRILDSGSVGNLLIPFYFSRETDGSEADESNRLSTTWWLITNKLLEVYERRWGVRGTCAPALGARAGDVLAYPGDQPHHYGNAGRGKVTFLSVVVVAPLGM
jgi:hypothetical protein